MLERVLSRILKKAQEDLSHMDQGFRHHYVGALDTLSNQNFALWRQVDKISTRLFSRVDGSAMAITIVSER